MDMLPKRLLFLLSILLLISGLSAVPRQQSGDQITFPSGLSVQGEFYSFWKKAPDPLLLFGEPLTSPLPHPIRDGWRVQYFQKVRMEYDPTQPAGKRVSLGNIGAWLHDETDKGDLADFPRSNSSCRSFSSGFQVCYAFLQFYDRYDGTVYFGLPISEVEFVDGQMVQYFERARLEWRSDQPEFQRVALTEIGYLDWSMHGSPKDEDGKSSPKEINLHPHAFVALPLYSPGMRQHIYVVVLNDAGQGVQGVEVNLSLVYEDKSVDTINLRPTNADGYTMAEPRIGSLPPNQKIIIQVSTNLPGGEPVTTEAWFRTWW